MGMKKKIIAMRYFFVWTGSIVLNTLGTFLLTELSGVYFIIIKALVAIVVAVSWNYQMQRIYVFKKRYGL